MKSLTFYIILTLLFSGPVIAQTSNKTRLGVKAGLSLSTLGSGSGFSYEYKPGIQGGLFFIVPLTETVYFSPQLLFTQKGGKVNNTVVFNTTVSLDRRVQYLDIPLLFGFKVHPKVAIVAGLQVSKLVGANTRATSGSNLTVTSKYDGDLKRTLIGGNLGLTYIINDNFDFNLNFINDFAHLAKKNYDTGERNSAFAFTIACKF